jgi:thiol-disulfide isomerase/thioredoxin
VVFATAGVGKLADLPGSRKALVGFGVPEGPASILGTLLPVAELATALALLLRPSAQWGAAAALVLLAVFVAGIANAMRHGEAPDCHCFGAIHSAPVGKGQIVRNGVLAAVAIFVLGWGTGPALDTWVSARSAAELVAVLTGVAAILLLAVAVQQWLEIRRLRTELLKAQAAGGAAAGLAVGAPAPSFELPGLGREAIALEALRERGRPILLVFMSAGCGPCEAMLPELERLQTTLVDRLTIGLVGSGTIERYGATRDAGGGLSLNDAREADSVLDEALKELVELFNAYRLTATPSGVLVTPQGTIGSATVNGHLAIEALIRLTLSRLPAAAPLAPTAA